MKKIKLSEFIFLIPIVFFLFLFLPFVGQAPAMDPMINFRESTQLFSGGFQEIVSYGVRLHPPILYSTIAMSFFLFGKSVISYNLIGFLLFTSTLIGFYFSFKKLLGNKFAAFATLLIFTNPLIVQNYFNLVSETLIISALVLGSVAYLYKKYSLLLISFLLLTLMKETALSIIFPFFIMLFFDTITKKSAEKKRYIVYQIICIAMIAFVFFSWNSFLKNIGTTEWRDTMFIKNGKGSFETVFHNVLTFKIFNSFLLGNLKNTLYFNFQWVFSLMLLISIFLKKKKFSLIEKKTLLLIILVSLSYALLALSFPTWTIPRYSAPLIFCFLFILSFFIAKAKGIWGKIILIILLIITFIANVSSLDPLSSKKGTVTLYGEKFYVKEFWNDGPDGIEYNMQYLRPVKHQNDLIKQAVKQNADFLIVGDCAELKLGERIWSMSIHNNFYPIHFRKNLECVSISDLKDDRIREQIIGKRILVEKEYKMGVEKLLQSQELLDLNK